MPFDVWISRTPQRGSKLPRSLDKLCRFRPWYWIGYTGIPFFETAMIGYSVASNEAVHAFRFGEAKLDHAILRHRLWHSELTCKRLNNANYVFGRPIPSWWIIKILNIGSCVCLLHKNVGRQLLCNKLHPTDRAVALDKPLWRNTSSHAGFIWLSAEWLEHKESIVEISVDALMDNGAVLDLCGGAQVRVQQYRHGQYFHHFSAVVIV